MEKHDEKIIGKDVGQVYRQLQILVDTTLEPFEFGRGQYLYFIHIVKHPGINQEALSAMLKIDKGTTARAVKKLCDNGYVIRKRSVEDKRAWELYPSKKSMDILPELNKTLTFINNKLLEGFSEKEEENIFFLLSKLMGNIENILLEAIADGQK